MPPDPPEDAAPLPPEALPILPMPQSPGSEDMCINIPLWRMVSRPFSLVGNPVERADFVYLLDPENNAPGSYAPEHGLTLSDAAAAILKCCEAEGAATVDLHSLSGFTQDKLVKFKRLRQGETYADLPYPDYIGHPFHPGKDEYEYDRKQEGDLRCADGARADR